MGLSLGLGAVRGEGLVREARGFLASAGCQQTTYLVTISYQFKLEKIRTNKQTNNLVTIMNVFTKRIDYVECAIAVSNGASKDRNLIWYHLEHST